MLRSWRQYKMFAVVAWLIVGAVEVSANTAATGTYRWWGIKIYDATLEHPGGQPNEVMYARPLKFTIVYDIDIDKDDLLETTIEQWEELAISRTESCQERQPWVQRLSQIWPNLEQGDSLTFEVFQNGESQFLYNQKPIGTLADTQFAPCFLAIWLAEDTSASSLRKQLLNLE
ncbi:MAG: chalcone isomerase family protein [Gammaproteobacteria bacterium]|nr:chalcone isomerase family protein [Gammaproteobacteria bacterium]